MITHLFDECFFFVEVKHVHKMTTCMIESCHPDHLNLKVPKTKLRLGLSTSFSTFLKKFPVLIPPKVAENLQKQSQKLLFVTKVAKKKKFCYPPPLFDPKQKYAKC